MKQIFLLCILFLLVSFCFSDRPLTQNKNVISGIESRTDSVSKRVYLIYIVPKNKKERKDYKTAIRNNILHVQHWFKQQLGKTFQLGSPVVQVIKSGRDDSWYAKNPNKSELFTQFWTNVLDDAGELLPETKSSNDRINIFYVDAHPACKQCGGCGNPGNVVIAANDLRGLVGESWIAGCPGEDYNFKPCRFVGGLAHELAHAFGIQHPGENDFKGTLMGSGFYQYPDCEFSAKDKNILLTSQWSKDFFYEKIPTKSFDCNDLADYLPEEKP